MSYCSKCGSYIPDSALSCPACGKLKFGSAASAQEQQKETWSQTIRQSAQQTRQDSRKEKRSAGKADHRDAYGQRKTSHDYTNMDYSYDYESKDDAKENKGIAALGYLGPMVLLPLLTKQDSPFVQFHAGQSVNLIAFAIFCSICGIVPIVGGLISAFGSIFSLYGLFKGITGALDGKVEKLPIIGDLNILGRFGGKS